MKRVPGWLRGDPNFRYIAEVIDDLQNEMELLRGLINEIGVEAGPVDPVGISPIYEDKPVKPEEEKPDKPKE